jgi:hypothetical protein
MLPPVVGPLKSAVQDGIPEPVSVASPAAEILAGGAEVERRTVASRALVDVAGVDLAGRPLAAIGGEEAEAGHEDDEVASDEVWHGQGSAVTETP